MSLALRPIAFLLALGSLFLVSAYATADGAADDPQALAERGRAMQRQVYAELPADDPWLEIGQQHLFGQIWTRPGLTIKERRLISLSVAAAVGSRSGYTSHLKGGLDSGDLSEEELWEWLIHFTQYAGYPKAAPVWSAYRKLLAERGSMPLPSMGVDASVAREPSGSVSSLEAGPVKPAASGE
jgi:4-carboxymuconolactone decarboxylase